MAQRILLVDDENSIVESLRYALEKEGYSVVEAADGAEALRLARSTLPDLVLLDIMLPGMSGFEVCRTLRKESTVPILMLTARSDEPDRIVGLDLGAEVTVDVDAQDLTSLARHWSKGGADIAFECAGVPRSLDACLGVVRRIGTLVQVGLMGRRIECDY